MLDFKSILKMATISLRINKMRSMLTSLGIIIGVSAVIIMLAVGAGASKKIGGASASSYVKNLIKNDPKLSDKAKATILGKLNS